MNKINSRLRPMWTEPGSIHCAQCGAKPCDPWDDNPDDFVWVDYGDLGEQVECIECSESQTSEAKNEPTN